MNIVVPVEKALRGGKYIRKYKTPSGKWAYVYKEPEGRGGSRKGPNVYRKYKSLANEQDVEHSLSMVKEMYRRRPQGMGTEMPLSSKGDLEKVLKNTRFAMISPGVNPDVNYNPRDEKIENNYDRMKHLLKRMGFCYTPGTGNYTQENESGEKQTSTEPSLLVMVHDTQDEREVAALGAMFKQNSVLFCDPEKGNKLLYTSGELEGKSTQWEKGFNYTDEEAEFYSKIKVGSKDVTFAMNLNFDLAKSLRRFLALLVKGVGAGGHKYIDKWRGKDGRWVYKYPPKGGSGKGGPKQVETEEPKAWFQSPPIEGEIPNNYPGREGFHIMFNELAVSVPQQAIATTFTHFGRTFVVHRKMGDGKWAAEWAVTEASTGLGTGIYGPDVDEVISRSIDRLNGKGKAWLDGIVVQPQYQVAEKNVSNLTEGWVVPKIRDRDGLSDLARLVVKDIDMHAGFFGPAPIEPEVFRWMESHQADVDDFINTTVQLQVLCVAHDLTPDEADGLWDGITTLEYYMDNNGDHSYLKEEIYDWVVNAWDIDEMERFQPNDYEGPNNEEPYIVLAHAIDNSLTPLEAYDALEELGDRRPFKEGGKRDYENLPPTEREKRLMKYMVDDYAELGGGVNRTMWLHMSEGDEEMEAVWKPESGEASHLRNNITRGTYYIREAACYEIAKEFGFADMVPVTKIRKYNGEMGSVQEFRGGAVPSEDGEVSEENAKRALLFDFLVFNTDRHGGNWMFDRDDLSKPILIDNGLTLPLTHNGFLSYLDGALGRVLQPAEYGPIVAGGVTDLCERLLGMGIESEAVDCFYQRVQYVKQKRKLPDGIEISSKPWRDLPTYTATKTEARA